MSGNHCFRLHQDYSLTRARILLGMEASCDPFSAADNAPVLSTGVVARGTTLPPSYPLRAVLQAPGFQAPKMRSSVSPVLCLHQLQLPMIPVGPGSAVFLLGAVWPCTDTGNQTVFSKQGIVNQSSIIGHKRKTFLLVPSGSMMLLLLFQSLSGSNFWAPKRYSLSHVSKEVLLKPY